MKVSKAIEILDLEVSCAPTASDPDLFDAHMLGIEALKERAKAKKMQLPLWHELLPGETPEGDTT